MSAGAVVVSGMPDVPGSAVVVPTYGSVPSSVTAEVASPLPKSAHEESRTAASVSAASKTDNLLRFDIPFTILTLLEMPGAPGADRPQAVLLARESQIIPILSAAERPDFSPCYTILEGFLDSTTCIKILSGNSLPFSVL